MNTIQSFQNILKNTSIQTKNFNIPYYHFEQIHEIIDKDFMLHNNIKNNNIQNIDFLKESLTTICNELEIVVNYDNYNNPTYINNSNEDISHCLSLYKSSEGIGLLEGTKTEKFAHLLFELKQICAITGHFGSDLCYIISTTRHTYKRIYTRLTKEAMTYIEPESIWYLKFVPEIEDMIKNCHYIHVKPVNGCVENTIMKRKTVNRVDKDMLFRFYLQDVDITKIIII